MCVLLITRLLRGVGRWARKPVNHTSSVAVVTPTDRPKSVRNCCLIELFCGVVCVATLPLWHFCWYRGFCHRTGSDLLLLVLISEIVLASHWLQPRTPCYASQELNCHVLHNRPLSQPMCCWSGSISLHYICGQKCNVCVLWVYKTLATRFWRET